MPIEITRDSLLIRSWQESDADGLGHAVFDNLDHIRPWLPWARGLPDDPAGVLEAIRQWLVEGVAKPDEAVGLFIDGDVVGGSGLHPRIGPGGALTDQAFGRPDIDRVEIHHDKANIASGGIPRALGFSLVEEVAEAPQTPQQSGVHLIWRLTRAQWSPPSGP
jgi:ribosomal-protein-serine acetyltransferase